MSAVVQDSRGPVQPPVKSEGSTSRENSDTGGMEVRARRVLKILRKKSEVRRRMLVKEVR